MASSDLSPLSKVEVEQLAYAAIGRHLRVMCVMCLMLLGLGFLLGHHVANQHARQIALEFERQSRGHAEQIVELNHHITVLRQAQSTDHNQLADLRRDAARLGTALDDARLEMAEAESLRRALIVGSLERMESDRRSMLLELNAHLQGDAPLARERVTRLVTQVIDGQMDRLRQLLDSSTPDQCPVLTDAADHPLIPVSESGPSPTIAGTPNGALAPPSGNEIVLFAAPEPPTETPVAIRPAPSIRLEPDPAPIAVPAPWPNRAAEPAPVEPGPVASPIRADRMELQPPAPPAPAPEISEPKRARGSLFFSPARKLEAAAVPAPALIVPVANGTPADSAPSRTK